MTAPTSPPSAPPAPDDAALSRAHAAGIVAALEAGYEKLTFELSLLVRRTYLPAAVAALGTSTSEPPALPDRARAVVDTADYLLDRVRAVAEGRPVRDLDEAGAAYRSAREALLRELDRGGS